MTRFPDHSRRTRHCGEPYGLHANGCERLPTVANANAKLGEHSLTPRPPSETGTLATHSGKKTLIISHGSSGGKKSSVSTKRVYWSTMRELNQPTLLQTTLKCQITCVIKFTVDVFIWTNQTIPKVADGFGLIIDLPRNRSWLMAP